MARGARASEINPAGEDVAAAGKRAPTLLTGVDASMAVMREEIFGPLLPVVPYRTLDEAIDFVNARPRPLALYVFEHDGAAVDRVIANTVSGGVAVNETIAAHRAGRPALRRRGRIRAWATTTAARASTPSPRGRPSSASRGSTASSSFAPPYGKRFEALVRLLLR